MTVRMPVDGVKLTITEERNGPGSACDAPRPVTGKDQFPMPSDDTRKSGSPQTTSTPTSDLDTFQRIVGEWGIATFPEATLASITAHLAEEAGELQTACTPQKPYEGMAESEQIAKEAADCLLLLLHVAHREGFSLIDRAKAKLEINRQRTWAPAEGGYWKHVGEDGAE